VTYDGLGMAVPIRDPRHRCRRPDGSFAAEYTPAERGRNEREAAKRKNYGMVGIWAGAALKRDLWRIANAERRSLSETVCGLIRLGLHRYFELAGDDDHAATIRAALETAL
jgi:hypothetical protein